MDGIDDLDADSIALRLLCEKAEERLEQARAACEMAHHRILLPDGHYRVTRPAGLD